MGPWAPRTQAGKIALLSVAFLVSVVLGNVSLKFIPVSFSQVASLFSLQPAHVLRSCTKNAAQSYWLPVGQQPGLGGPWASNIAGSHACWQWQLVLLRPPAAEQQTSAMQAVGATTPAFTALLVLLVLSRREPCVTQALPVLAWEPNPGPLAQAVGATTPAFTALLALLLLRRRESHATYAALVPVVAGIVVATGAEPSFNAAGFSAALGATAARALKAVVQVTRDHRVGSGFKW